MTGKESEPLSWIVANTDSESNMMNVTYRANEPLGE